MNLVREWRGLSTLRKNQQITTFCLLFTNALLVAYTLKAYVSMFGADGLVLKEYILQGYGLILLIPLVGAISTRNPVKTFSMCFIADVIWLIGYAYVNYSQSPTVLLLSTFLLVTSNLMMRPLNTKVYATVNGGCDTYSLFATKLDSIYTAVGALFGILLITYDVNTYVMLALLSTSMLANRWFKYRVFVEVYSK